MVSSSQKRLNEKGLHTAYRIVNRNYSYFTKPMRLEKIGLHVEGIKTKVFDVDKKELLGVFPSRSAAGQFTGLPASRVTDYVRDRTICSSNKLNKRICFR
jgi:hypothetical protein